MLNFNDCGGELFSGNNKEDDIEEIMGEVYQTANDENEEPVEIVKEDADNPIDENCSIMLAESDGEEKEKRAQ